MEDGRAVLEWYAPANYQLAIRQVGNLRYAAQ